MDTSIEAQASAWDRFFSHDEFEVWPAETIVRYLHRRRREGPLGRALDFACGGGRHSWLLHELGATVDAIDVSLKAVEVTGATLARHGCEATVRHYDGRVLPYDDDSFDVAVAFGVLDNMMPEQARACAVQIRRVLRPGGAVVLTLVAPASAGFADGAALDHNTYSTPSTNSAGLVRCYFEPKDAAELLAGFSHWRAIERVQRWAPGAGEAWSVLNDKWTVEATK